MIVETEAPAETVKAATPNAEFHVRPPSNSPLVASSGLSLRKEDDNVLLEWSEDQPALVDERSSRVRDEFISRSREDIVKFPQSARTHTNLGVALANQHQLDAAVHEFEIALKIDPRNYLSAIMLARVKVEQGNFEEAERLYSELEQAFPEESAPSLSLAFIAMKREDFEKSEQLFRRALSRGADGVLPKYLLSMVLLRLGKNREAIRLLKSSVRSEVRSPALYQALGTAYAMSGDYSRAETNFYAALTLAPNLGSAVQGLARVLIEQENAPRVLALLTDYLERSPGDHEARRLLGIAYASVEQYKAAAHQFTLAFRAVSEDGTSVLAQNQLSGLAGGIGAYWALDRNDKEAEKWLLRAIELAPELSPIPYQNLARVQLRTDRELDAYRTLVRVKDLFPTEQDTSVLLAVVYEQQGMYERGIRELAPLVKSGNAEAVVYSSLGCQLDYAGDLAGAARILREGLEKYPVSGPIIHNLAYVLLMLGKVTEGREVLEKYKPELAKYAKNTPTYEPVLLATWGLVNILEGRVEIGIRLYKQAARLASKMGQRKLAGSALQKMHRELAKVLLAQGSYAAALDEVKAGLAIKAGREPYRRELKVLHEDLERRLN